MNNNSLAQLRTQNQQQEPSWIDDPFDLKGFVKGVAPLSHNASLKDYALELVSSYAEFIGDQYELDFDKISSPYQLELLRLYIESIDREIEWACYGEDLSINSEFLCAMLAMLKDSNPKTRANFAQVTTRNLLTYYHDALQEVIDLACEEHYCNEMGDDGYRAVRDLESGDRIWKS